MWVPEPLVSEVLKEVEKPEALNSSTEVGSQAARDVN